MSGKLILLIEDSKKVQNYNKKMLQRCGFEVETALTLAHAEALLKVKIPDAIVLDIGMPDGSGFDFLENLRLVSKIPVLLLTGFSDTKDVVIGFKRGCDDYLTKPYTFEVLLARLERLLQRAEQIPETIKRDLISLDILSRKAFVKDVDLLLTPRDFSLLQFFIQNENRLLDTDFIYEKVWGHSMGEDSQALTNAISRLRKKLLGCGYTISMEYNTGYRFERGE